MLKILEITNVIVPAYIHEKAAWVVSVGMIHDRRINSCVIPEIAATLIADISVEFLMAIRKGIQQMYAAKKKFIGGKEADNNRPLPIARYMFL